MPFRRLQPMLVMSFLSMQAVYIHAEIGSLDRDLAQGIERSMLSIRHSPGAGECWMTASVTFDHAFTDHVDSWRAANESAGTHPSVGLSLD